MSVHYKMLKCTCI